MGAEPSQGQNAREREQVGKPGMKGESAQTQEPTNHMQPGNRAQSQTGSQAEERRAEPQGQGGKGAQVQERTGQAENGARPEQPGRAADQNRAGQAQNREVAPQTGQARRQITGQNVQATGKANLPQDKAAQVAQTLMSSGSVQSSPTINVNEVNVGADLPGDIVINPLPPAIVEIVPEFSGYDYFLAGDEVVIVDPATRQVVEIIQETG
jgi:hypothetical protein